MKLIVRYSLLLLIIAVSSCRNKNAVKLPDMRHSYSKRSKKPFGAFTAYNMLKEKYSSSGADFSTVNKPFYKNDVTKYAKKGLFVVISESLLMSEEDIESLLHYVENGNQVFISSEYISDELMDTLGLQVQYQDLFSMFQNNQQAGDALRNTTVQMADTLEFGTKKYGFYYFPFKRCFLKTDSIEGVRTLGLNENEAPDFITLPYGDGRFFFHLHPEAFSNYFLLTNNNKDYFENVLTYIPSIRNAVYWDDYYRMGNSPGDDFSMFSVFLKYPMLKWALFVAMGAILFYVAFGSKRRQRIVPVKQKYNNDSVSFVETIGRLYLQKKDNHNIADKMITYFMEYIRTHYYLNTSQLNSEFFSSLSRKSEVPEQEVKNFFENISNMQQSEKISDQQLLDLNNRIQSFLKK